ncbi:MAG: hypothetical protein EOP06_02145 [Proteobacteria bacterium]|nr:MAG: hypothetical protein EOP06_02145 [Pseudomonadota bacterium]
MKKSKNSNSQALLLTVFFSVLLSQLIFVANAEADKERGGGRGVVCRGVSGKILSIELQDYFEAVQTSSLHLNLGNKATYQEMLDVVAARVSTLDTGLAAFLRLESQNFLSNTAFVDHAQIVAVADWTSPIEPKPNCHFEQMAANRVAPLPFEKKYLIDEELWAAANEETRAGLVLHEILYLKERRRLNESPYSDSSRYFNGLISSEEFTALSPKTYSGIIRRLGWDRTHCIAADDFTLIDEGRPYSASCDVTRWSESTGHILDGYSLMRQTFQTSRGPILALEYSLIQFHENRRLRSVRLAAPYPVKYRGALLLLTPSSTLNFDPDGTLSSIHPAEDIEYVKDGRTHTLKATASAIKCEILGETLCE